MKTKLLTALLVLLMVSGATRPCRGGHLGPERLVGFWTVSVNGVDQLIRVRPDLSVDYGVGELSGKLVFTARRTVVWHTRGKLGESSLTFRLLRGCHGEVTMALVRAEVHGGPQPTLHQKVTWTPTEPLHFRDLSARI